MQLAVPANRLWRRHWRKANGQAFVRHPGAITTQHPSLAIIQGEILDRKVVRRAVAGQDVAVSALGTRNGPAVLPEGTRNILEALKEHGVRRSLWVTSLGPAIA